MMVGYNEEPSGFRASQQIQNLYFQPGFLGPLQMCFSTAGTTIKDYCNLTHSVGNELRVVEKHFPSFEGFSR